MKFFHQLIQELLAVQQYRYLHLMGKIYNDENENFKFKFLEHSDVVSMI
jgi:hypothetical protein